MSAPRTSYFKLGLFIIMGFLLLLLAIIVLSVGAIFEDAAPAETYFNESVQGLDVGSPVKFRGVQIGSVANIGFVMDKYPEFIGPTQRYVLVELSLRKELSPGVAMEQATPYLREEIERGLRVRLTSQGLTGVVYLEIDYFKPEQNPPLPLTWTPEALYIPSTSSTMSRVEQAISNIAQTLDNIETINFAKMGASINDLLEDLRLAVNQADVSSLGELLARDLIEARTFLEKLNAMLDTPEARAVIPQASSAMTGLNALVRDSGEDVASAMSQLNSATSALRRASETVEGFLADPRLSKNLEDLPTIMENVNLVSVEMARTMARLERLTRSLDELVRSRLAEMDAIIRNTDQLMENLDELSDDVKRNPSRLFFSEPPHRVDPGLMGGPNNKEAK